MELAGLIEAKPLTGSIGFVNRSALLVFGLLVHRQTAIRPEERLQQS